MTTYTPASRLVRAVLAVRKPAIALCLLGSALLFLHVLAKVAQ